MKPKKMIFGGRLINDCQGAVSRMPSYERWIKDVGEACFFRSGITKTMYRVDPAWRYFSAFDGWYSRQGKMEGGCCVSPYLAQGERWRKYSPDTCEVVPLRIHNRLKHYHHGNAEIRVDDNDNYSIKMPGKDGTAVILSSPAKTMAAARCDIDTWVGLFLGSDLSNLGPFPPGVTGRLLEKINDIAGRDGHCGAAVLESALGGS